jgi:endo-1,4-beta-mannosidase
MHGYPIYASWSAGPLDADFVSFLAAVTRWLGGKDVLFAEFGAPTRDGDPEAEDAVGAMLLSEQDAAAYTARAMAGLHEAGSLGALVWCYADYIRAIWGEAPLDRAPHERHFGVWRGDGSAKPSVESLAGRRERLDPPAVDWLDADPGRFYDDPKPTLVRLYAAARGRAAMARPVL